MSTLCLTPFDIYSIDSSSIVLPKYLSKPVESSTLPSSSLITIVIETAKSFLSDFGPTRDAASVCLSSMLTRPDTDMNYLNDFLNYSIRQFQWYYASSSLSHDEVTSVQPSLPQMEISQFTTQQQRHCLYLGILQSLNQIFKKGHREKLLLLLPSIQNLFAVTVQLTEAAVQTLERKFLCKLLQRIGMTLLVPIEATWRYQKGYRSMKLSSLKQSTSSIANVTEISKTSVIDSESIEIPEEIEEIMDKVLSLLSDKDTIVRWSAAKGIGRLCMRLNKSFALDILQAIINQFDDKLSEHIWHGGCLALAELSRRGLLLPDNLSEVVPLILQALCFDLQKGQHFVGANVRDAACYVCWAFARAYSPNILKPFMKDLSIALLNVTIFDREVNCRRAAAAAFQENVGRQGNENFLFGIEIITIADFFSVSNRIRSYMELSCDIVRLDVEFYFFPFINHLKDYKINHWDKEIRDLASKTMARLFLLASASMVGYANDLLSELLDNCLSEDLYVRHGSMLAVSRLLLVLIFQTGPYCSSNNINNFVLTSDNSLKIEHLVPMVEKKRLYRGKGGELIREAICLFIETVSRLRFQFQNSSTLVALIESLNEHLKQPQTSIQQLAKNALRQFLFYFFAERRVIPINPFPNNKILNLTVQKYMDFLKPGNEGNVAIVRGYIMALGVLPDRFVLLPSPPISTVASSSSVGVEVDRSSHDKKPVLTESTPAEESDDELPIKVNPPSVAPPIQTHVALCNSVSSASRPAPTKHLNGIIDILDDYSNNAKLINGEYDAETCQCAIESAVELAERLIASSIFEQSYLVRVFQLLLKGCDDYSIDKRGDTGSWVRSSALKGFERLLSAVFGNISLVQQFTNSKVGVVGGLIQTSYGIGIISSPPLQPTLNSAFRAGKIVKMRYFPSSLGHQQSLEDSWMLPEIARSTDPGLSILTESQIEENYPNYDHILDNLQKFILFFSQPLLFPAYLIPRDSAVSPSPILLIVRQILKQLSEKLDSVRSVAGNFLERLLFQRFQIRSWEDEFHHVSQFTIPDENILVRSVEKAVLSLRDGSEDLHNSNHIQSSREISMKADELHDLNQTEELREEILEDLQDEQVRSSVDRSTTTSMINWHRPDHVYPIAVNFLASSHYFDNVFCGFVISMGGLTEAVVKASNEAFLQYTQSLASSHDQTSISVNKSTFLPTILQSVESLFQTYEKNDRIILPLLKTVQLLIKQNILEMFVNYTTQGYERLNEFYSKLILQYLFQELRQASQIPKFFLIVDAFILLLSMISNSEGGYQIPKRKAVFYLLQLLSHRFPRVRKCKSKIPCDFL